MRLKKLILSISFCCLALLSMTAQDNYEKSIGARGGTLSGLTYKQFIGRFTAIEGIAGFNFGNGKVATITGLYEHHIFINYQLNWYAGAGLSLGANENDFRITGEAILGLEYTTNANQGLKETP